LEKVVSTINGWPAEKRDAAVKAVLPEFAPMQSATRIAINAALADGDGFRAAVLHGI